MGATGITDEPTQVADAAAALEGAVSSLLAAIEEGLDMASEAELDAAVVALQQQRARLGAAAAQLLSRWDAERVWADDGSRSAAARLGRATRCSQSSAKVELRRARQLRTMPATLAALAAGRLSLDHVDLLGRANRPWRDAVFPEHEDTLVQECTELRFADAVKMVDYWCQRADADGAEDEARRRRTEAHLTAAATLDGMVHLQGLLEPVGGATFTNELDRLERKLYLDDQRDGVERTRSQRLAAALVEMSRRSAAMPPDARSARPLFTVLLGDDSFARLCELTAGTVITPGTLVPHLDTADLEVVLFDGPTTVISVSHRRTFTGALRRAIQVRDRRCTHPAVCDEPADRCDVDHIVAHSQGGPTSQFSGRLQCTPHNRNAHLHDQDAQPWPSRTVTRLDELRARLRWRYLHDHVPD